MLGPIEKAINAANLGINPQSDGVVIRLAIPPLIWDADGRGLHDKAVDSVVVRA